MTFVTQSFHILSLLCAARGKPGLYLSASGPCDDINEIRRAAPFVTDDILVELACGTGVYVFFDTEVEMDQAFRSVVGDDGPTRSNQYNGPGRVYAASCDANGVGLSENT